VARRCRHHAACGSWIYRSRFCSSVRALVGGGPALPHQSPFKQPTAREALTRAGLRERSLFYARR
jgi:hypothetical protein